MSMNMNVLREPELDFAEVAGNLGDLCLAGYSGADVATDVGSMAELTLGDQQTGTPDSDNQFTFKPN